MHCQTDARSEYVKDIFMVLKKNSLKKCWTDTHCTRAWARSCRLGESRRGTSAEPESRRKHCRYIPHSWVFIFLHQGMRLKQKQRCNYYQNSPTALLLHILTSRGQRHSLLIEPGSTPGEGSVLELSPDVL